MTGTIFLYSTSPAPHESTILRAVRRDRRCDAGPIRAVALRAGLEQPDDADLAQLGRQFGRDPEFPVGLTDSGLGCRGDAADPAVISRLEQADLVLIGGGSPVRILELTRDTPALAALLVAIRRGTVVAGCSAGAIVLGAGHDIAPWRRAFPTAPILGIPDGAMAVITEPGGIDSVGEPVIKILTPGSAAYP